MTGRLDWPQEPYRGLAYYDAADALLFAGRDDDVEHCVHYLSQTQTRVLILHGRTGCGKSSFLRAGLIPSLEERGYGYQFLRGSESPGDEGVTTDEHPPVFIRCGPDPVARIAEEIFRFCSRPLRVQTAVGARELDLRPVTAGHDSLQSFIDACNTEYGELFRALQRLSKVLYHTLVIILDQAEEVLTLTDAADPRRRSFFFFLKELIDSGLDLKLVVALRKEHFGEFFDYVQFDASLKSDVKQFLLRDLERDDVELAIVLPTSEERRPGIGSAYQRYRFKLQPGLARRIAGDLFMAVPSGGVLPVMQIVCRDLYNEVRRRPEPWVIDDTLYVGGERITGRVGRHITASLQAAIVAANPQEQNVAVVERQWREALMGLVRRESDGTTTTDVITADRLYSLVRHAGFLGDPGAILDRLVRPEMLILRRFSRLSGELLREETFFSLGHDAIGLALQEWKVRESEAERRRQAERLVRVRTAWTLASVAAALAAVAIAAFSIIQSDTQLRNDKANALKAAAERSSRIDLGLALVAGMEEAVVAESRHRFFGSWNPPVAESLQRILQRLPTKVIGSPFAPKNVSRDEVAFDVDDFWSGSAHPLPAIDGFLFEDENGRLAVGSVQKGDAYRINGRLDLEVSPDDFMQGAAQPDPGLVHVLSFDISGVKPYQQVTTAALDGSGVWKCDIACFTALSSWSEAAGITRDLLFGEDGLFLVSEREASYLVERFAFDTERGRFGKALEYELRLADFRKAIGESQASTRLVAELFGPYLVARAVRREPASQPSTGIRRLTTRFTPESFFAVAAYDMRHAANRSPMWVLLPESGSPLAGCGADAKICASLTAYLGVGHSSRLWAFTAIPVRRVSDGAARLPREEAPAGGITVIDAASGRSVVVDVRELERLRLSSGGGGTATEEGRFSSEYRTTVPQLRLAGSIDDIWVATRDDRALDVYRILKGRPEYVGTALAPESLSAAHFNGDASRLLAGSESGRAGHVWDVSQLRAANDPVAPVSASELIATACKLDLIVAFPSKAEWFEATSQTELPPRRCAGAPAPDKDTSRSLE